MIARRVRVRPIQQMEAAECGVACLAMLLDYHGHRAPLAEVRQSCGTSRDGNSALQLLEGARHFGLLGRGRAVSLEKLSTLRRPAILHWDMNHFVVLESVRRQGLTIVDPASGRRFVPMAEVDALFSGVALELWPGPSFERRAAPSLSLQRYWLALSKAKKVVVFVLAANVARQILAVLFPAASQILIDHVIIPGRSEWMVPILALLTFGAIGQVTLGYLQGASQALLQGALHLELVLDFGRRMLHLPLDFLESRSRGDLLQRVELQAQLQGLLSQTAQAAFDLVFVALLAGLMLVYDTRLAALSLGLISLRVIVLRKARASSAQRVASELAARGREQATLMEATSAPELIKGLGLEGRLLERYERRLTERGGFGIRSARLQIALSAWLLLLGGVTEAVILWFGGCRVIDGAMTMGVFAGFLTIRSLIDAPLVSLLGLFEGWMRIRGVLERSDDILSVAAVPDGPWRVARLAGRVELRDVSFRYGSGGSWILRDVNLRVEPGEHVAILGASGQGKSTLLKLMCGLLEPTTGQVLLDGIPVGELDREALAKRVGVVLQEPLILEGRLIDGVSLRDPQASAAALSKATQLACFEEVIARLPDGYGAAVAALGANFSAGERQRLALAQALVGDPALLLLDEATCALDLETEQRVLDGLAQLPATCISVTHRPSVAARAGRVCAVVGGRVVVTSPSAPLPVPDAVPPDPVPSREAPRTPGLEACVVSLHG